MVYYVFAGLIYVCILAILMLALIFGLRARRNIKKEKVTALADGFSPLDIQRIFVGKTYPRRLTRALIVHWAQMGYIRVKHINKTHVQLILVRKLPSHESGRAIFFDRGTYVRERDLFNLLFPHEERERIVNINLPLFKRRKIKEIGSKYAVREDEGVYSSVHYTLKVITFILSVLPCVFAGVYLMFAEGGTAVGFLPPLMIILGLYVFRFMLEIPFPFRFLWCFAWVGASIGLLFDFYQSVDDPLYICYSAIAIMFVGTFLLIQFVDYREKNNLADYSDLVNYKKYLLFSKKEELINEDYYAALPYLYAFNIKFLVKRKFNRPIPDWYISENGERGNLL